MHPFKDMNFATWKICLMIPLVAQGQPAKQNEDVDIDYNITYSNHCQGDTHRIQIYHGVTISDCITECGLRPHCQALNHHGQMGLCELFTEVEVDFLPGGCIHVQHKDIRLRKSPCVADCDNGLACDTITKTCTIKECMTFPQLMNGVVYGNNKGVGMKLLRTCDQNYKHKNGIKQSTCHTDGTWKPRVECSRDCSEIGTPSGALVVTDQGTLEGSERVYTCQTGFVLVSGSLTRVCQSDGEWQGTEPLCQETVCTVSGTCYIEYENRDFGGYDVNWALTTSFEDCSSFCETLTYMSISHCPALTTSNCFCKNVSINVGLVLNHHVNCNFYYKV